MEIRTARILYDENHTPIYVQIDYDEWLTLEPYIESLPEPETPYVPLSERNKDA